MLSGPQRQRKRSDDCKHTHSLLSQFSNDQLYLKGLSQHERVADTPMAVVAALGLCFTQYWTLSPWALKVLKKVRFIQTPPLARRCQLHQAPIFKHHHLANRIRVAERDHGPFLNELVHQSARWLAHPRLWQLFQLIQPLLSYMYEASCK